MKAKKTRKHNPVPRTESWDTAEKRVVARLRTLRDALRAEGLSSVADDLENRFIRPSAYYAFGLDRLRKAETEFKARLMDARHWRGRAGARANPRGVTEASARAALVKALPKKWEVIGKAVRVDALTWRFTCVTPEGSLAHVRVGVGKDGGPLVQKQDWKYRANPRPKPNPRPKGGLPKLVWDEPAGAATPRGWARMSRHVHARDAHDSWAAEASAVGNYVTYESQGAKPVLATAYVTLIDPNTHARHEVRLGSDWFATPAEAKRWIARRVWAALRNVVSMPKASAPAKRARRSR